jgi:hypothetical protein
MFCICRWYKLTLEAIVNSMAPPGGVALTNGITFPRGSTVSDARYQKQYTRRLGIHHTRRYL